MHWSGTVTQSAADSRKTIAIDTGVKADTSFALKVHRIVFDLRPSSAKSWLVGTAGVSFEVTLAASTSGFEEKFTLAFSLDVGGRTAVYIPTQHVNNLPDDFPLIADGELTMTVDSVATGHANVVDWRVDYDRVELTKLELSKILMMRF